MKVRMKFRDETPVRRPDPRIVSRHQDHKPELKDDFRSYCGYCHCHDRFRDAYYEVDHFIPQDFFKKSGNISTTDYFNLVYSCRPCNNSKRNEWPSQSETDYNLNDEGFIDPCNSDYDKQFYRCSRGRIHPETALGDWMHKIFKFGVRERQIELVWQLEKLDALIQDLIQEQRKYIDNSNIWNEIELQLSKCCRLYYEYDRELRNFRSA